MHIKDWYPPSMSSPSHMNKWRYLGPGGYLRQNWDLTEYQGQCRRENVIYLYHSDLIRLAIADFEVEAYSDAASKISFSVFGVRIHNGPNNDDTFVVIPANSPENRVIQAKDSSFSNLFPNTYQLYFSRDGRNRGSLFVPKYTAAGHALDPYDVLALLDSYDYPANTILDPSTQRQSVRYADLVMSMIDSASLWLSEQFSANIAFASSSEPPLVGGFALTGNWGITSTPYSRQQYYQLDNRVLIPSMIKVSDDRVPPILFAPATWFRSTLHSSIYTSESVSVATLMVRDGLAPQAEVQIVNAPADAITLSLGTGFIDLRTAVPDKIWQSKVNRDAVGVLDDLLVPVVPVP